MYFLWKEKLKLRFKEKNNMLAQKILNVMTKIGFIIKDKKNEEKGFDYALIEIRDDEFDNLEEGAADWGERLGQMLEKYISVSKR